MFDAPFSEAECAGSWDLSQRNLGAADGCHVLLPAQDEKRLYYNNQQGTPQQPHRSPVAATPTPPSSGDKEPPTAAAADGRRRRTAAAKALQQHEEDEQVDEEVYDENEHELYCVCQQPYNVDTAMIECDLCNEWYHLKCMGLTQARPFSTSCSLYVNVYYGSAAI